MEGLPYSVSSFFLAAFAECSFLLFSSSWHQLLSVFPCSQVNSWELSVIFWALMSLSFASISVSCEGVTSFLPAAIPLLFATVLGDIIFCLSRVLIYKCELIRMCECLSKHACSKQEGNLFLFLGQHPIAFHGTQISCNFCAQECLTNKNPFHCCKWKSISMEAC